MIEIAFRRKFLKVSQVQERQRESREGPTREIVCRRFLRNSREINTAGAGRLSRTLRVSQ